MSRIARIVGLILLFMLAVTMFPVGVAAQASDPATETVTIQLDGTTPTGMQIIGALVVKRTPGTGKADLKFNGTINGQPASATATATETWSGNGTAVIKVTEITSWNSSMPKPALMNIELVQVSAGLLTLNGIPMAASGSLLPPGSGNASYVVGNAGEGVDTLVFLPNTGQGGVLAGPLLIAGFLVTICPMLVAFGALLNKLAGRMGATAPSAK